ncbi:MAG: hypothetical protein HA496_07580 [Thaumarchaeota archaeon]|nr:hypothetical protein [Nitrososphaerota archaeon]
MDRYQKFLSPGFKPFDPIRLAGETERIVTRLGGGSARVPIPYPFTGDRHRLCCRLVS